MKHGGNIYEIAQQYNLTESEIIDFSANINPLGIPQTLKEMIQEGIPHLTAYPDIHYSELKDAISQKYTLSVENIYLGNGGAQVIFDFIRCVRPAAALVLQPTFIEYERALRAAGSKIIDYFLPEEKDFRLNVEGVIGALDSSVEMVVLCNPNNPTGTYLPREDLNKLLKACYERKIYLMIDEAFMDFLDPHYSISMLPLCSEFPNLLVTRSFTKFYSVPGLRLGFGSTSSQLIKARLEEIKIPWSLNYFAGAFGRVLAREANYELKTYQWLQQEKGRITKVLKGIEGLKVYEPAVNFILLKLLDKNIDGRILKERMLKYKLLIREADTFKGLNSQFVRIAIKDSSQNNILINALEAALKGV